MLDQGELTFETYAPGENDLAYYSARRLVEGTLPRGGSLVIYGDPTTGKSHLLNSIFNAMPDVDPDRYIMMITGKQYGDEYSRAVVEKTLSRFHRRCREIELLLVDDLQYLARKPKYQEGFLHAFDAILAKGGQVVVVTDRHPSRLDGFDQHLTSRLAGGMTAPTCRITPQSRVEVLRGLSRGHKIEATDEVLKAIAERTQGNAVKLRGALIRFGLYADLCKQPLTVELVGKAVEEIIPPSPTVTSALVLEEVLAYSGIQREHLLDTRRTADVAMARQIAMYLMRELTNDSLPQIGRFLGGRDHSTVIHGIRKVEGLLGIEKLPQVQVIRERILCKAEPARSV